MKRKNTIIGVFVGHERGFGFVEIEGREDDIFIPPNATNSAMNGDVVKVEIILESDDGKRAEGKVVEIIQRKVKTVVGTFTKGRNYGFVIPDDKKLSNDIYISKNLSGKARSDDKVVVQITKYPYFNKSAEGKIIEVLGKTDDAGVDLLSILRTYDYKKVFPKAVQKEAKMMPQVVLNANGRTDLRNKMIFTIDGADTKDIDDAISIEKQGDNYLLGVHIADVSSYVVEDSALDKEAAKRGTSVYLIDAVIPMLPPELSNGICSLNEGVDRNTLSIDILLDKDANILNSRLYKAVINSKKKMTYDNVHKVIDVNEVPNGYAPFVDTLMLMKELALKLIDKRNREGAIDFNIPETKIILNEEGRIEEIKPYETTLANRLIEQFMVLANECVAKTFSDLKIPFIYRIHEVPDVDRIKRFNVFLNNLNYKDAIPDKFSPKDMQRVLKDFKGKPEEKVISMMGLRTMQLAKYSSQNMGHFGLALKDYCHFTSPIRRYPDLFIHRVISEYLTNQSIASSKINKFARLAVKYAETSSDTERRAEEAEDELETMKKCEYMKNHIGEEFIGCISGITAFGMFVELENTIEGLVHVERMNDDYYVFDEENVSLIGEHTRKIYKLGDMVKIRVVDADKLTRRIDFECI